MDQSNAMWRQKEDLDFGSPHSSLHLAHSRMNSRQRLICGLKGGDTDNTGWDEVSINSDSLAKPNTQDNINKDRDVICPKFYTTGFSGKKFYTVNFT